MTTSPETVTSLTAQTLDPGKAVERIFPGTNEGLLFSIWRAVDNILQVLGIKQAKTEVNNFDDVDFDKVASMGAFPFRRSDLFLKVITRLPCCL